MAHGLWKMGSYAALDDAAEVLLVSHLASTTSVPSALAVPLPTGQMGVARVPSVWPSRLSRHVLD